MADSETAVTLIITDDKLKAFVTVRDESLVSESLLDRLIKEKDVKFGIDRGALNDLIQNPRKGTFIIAQGRPPKEGKDGYMQYLFTSRPARKEQTEENVDFREIFDVPSVNANTILAIYHPAVKGEDGIGVTGQPLPARPVVELAVRAGKGASLSRDGLFVTSTTNGRPWVKKQGRNVTVGVDPVYQHDGDVDIKSGNLRFNGDVVITGNVTENMIVEVSGNLRVMGFVSRAIVNVGGNLDILRVVTASKINAGGTTASYNKIENKLREIQKAVSGIDAKARVLMNNLARRKQKVQFGQVLITLLDRQYSGFGKQVKEFEALVKGHGSNAPAEFNKLIKALSTMCGIKAMSLTSLKDVQQSIAESLAFLESLNKEPSNIVANSVWNSEIHATGDVKITGQGSFNSIVTSLGAVEIMGVFRGGEIYARKGIRAREIGGPMGVKTIAKTQEGSMIKASRVYNGTVLQIGHRIHTVKRDENMVLARLDEHGDIVLH